MFNRSVKLQFNKMKYANLVDKQGQTISNPAEHFKNIVRSRSYFILFGLSSGFSIMNYDVYLYKLTRGLARWKKRILSYFPHNDSHGHGHSHSHGQHSHDSHDNSKHEHVEHKEEKKHQATHH